MRTGETEHNARPKPGTLRGAGLFALISLGNLANLSFLSPAIPGPEEFLAGRPILLVTVIFVQIVVTLVLVGVLARRETTVSGATRDVGRGVAPRERDDHEGARTPATRIMSEPSPQ